MEAPASPVTRAPSVCALHHSLGLSVNIPLTVPVIQTLATMVVHVNTPQRRHTTSASAPQTSMVMAATSWITTSRGDLAVTFCRLGMWRSPAQSQSVRSLSTTSSVMCSVTTTRAVGTTVTARSTLTIHGRTAPPRCSAGDTSTMESVIHSVIMLDVSLMDLTVRNWKDSASKRPLHLH